MPLDAHFDRYVLPAGPGARPCSPAGSGGSRRSRSRCSRAARLVDRRRARTHGHGHARARRRVDRRARPAGGPDRRRHVDAPAARPARRAARAAGAWPALRPAARPRSAARGRRALGARLRGGRRPRARRARLAIPRAQRSTTRSSATRLSPLQPSPARTASAARGFGSTACSLRADGVIAAERRRGRRRGLPLGRRAARARDRRQPGAGAVLRQLAVRLGRADRRRARRALDRLLGRWRARRPVPDARTCCSARSPSPQGSCWRSRSSTSGCSSGSSTGIQALDSTRWSRRSRSSVPRASFSAAVSPMAVRLVTRSLERIGRTAGRLFAISTAGSIAGTFATAFWLVPELGTDQVLAVGALTLLVAATVIAIGSAPARAGRRARRRGGCLRAAPCSRSRRSRARRSAGAAATNWSPLYRERETQSPNVLDPASVDGNGFAVRFAKDTRYHRLVVADDGEIPLPALRQLLPERHVPEGPLPHAVPRTRTTSTWGSPTTRTPGACSSSGSAGARRRSGCGATSRGSSCRSWSSTRTSSTRRTVGSRYRATSD